MNEIIPAWVAGRVDETAVQRAASVLAAHRVVGMPTETVYGLAARAEDPVAVRRVFEIKGRPADHPVIVHVAGADAIGDWGASVPGYARALAAALWPGPLTLVVPAADAVGRYLTGGQDTVGLRCPAHPVALALIEQAGPVAAPSANRFGQVSPTSAADVASDLGERLTAEDLILDGGECPVGVESTILDCTGTVPRLLRSGAVEPAEVQRVTGLRTELGGSSVRAPGGLTSHYAPRAKVYLQGDAQPGAGFLAGQQIVTPAGAIRLASPTTTRDYAATLYRALRDADARGLTDVWAVPPDDDSALAQAVRDRLTRAAAD